MSVEGVLGALADPTRRQVLEALAAQPAASASALARLETRVAFEELLRRLPDYEISGEPERVVSTTFRGFEQLPIAF